MGFLGKLLRLRRMSKEEFKETVRARITANYPDIKIKSDLDFGFECEVYGSNITLFLDSAYADYLGRPKQLVSIIDHVIQAMLLERVDEFVPWEEAKHRIYPSMKPEGYFDCIRQMQDGDAVVDNMVIFDWQKGLKIVMVLDFERSMPLRAEGRAGELGDFAGGAQGAGDEEPGGQDRPTVGGGPQ